MLKSRMVYGEYMKHRIVSGPFITMDRPYRGSWHGMAAEKASVCLVLAYTSCLRIPGNGGISEAGWLWETPESYGNHQNDSFNRETGKLKNERGRLICSFVLFPRFVSSFPSYCLISVLVLCRFVYPFKRFGFVSFPFCRCIVFVQRKRNVNFFLAPTVREKKTNVCVA